jgi:High-temperature-induced dauer-formation protein
MANVSPYLKNLSTTTSSRLISLYNSMISPSFLLAKESNPALLHILLETLNNIIEHQHANNPILLYAIIRNHAKFQSLQRFDLQKSLSDLEERKKAHEEKEHLTNDPAKPSIDLPTPTTPLQAFSVGDDEEEEEEEHQETKPLSEKARGKLPEGVEIPRRESSFSLRSASGMLSPGVEKKEFYPTESWVSLLLNCLNL